jgi:hypothetical protein
VDDVRISDRALGWGEIYPRGHARTETSALDFVDRFDHAGGEPLALWRPGSRGSGWRYSEKGWEDATATGDAPEERRSLYAGAARGFHPIFHPDAYGHMSSVEAGVAFETLPDGWAGVFVKSTSGPERPFEGYSFSINPRANEMRLAAHRGGRVVASKTLPYDFRLAAKKTYTLTLTSTEEDVLRGYVDGNNLISMRLDRRAPRLGEGHAGLFTQNATAHFDNVHFSALTPVSRESRLVQQRVFADGQGVEEAGGYEALTLSAFRWNKRYGLVPWRRTYKDPEPPGNIFGAASDEPERPNPPAPWRSEDSAVSDIINVDGKILLIHRGNPRLGGVSGVAQIGVINAEAETFDGVHFADPNAGVPNEEAELLRGHRDPAPPEMKEPPPRNVRFQVNDQGGAYVGDGKVVVFAREFRNYVAPYPWYRRLVYGVYDVNAGRWENDGEGYYSEWSKMDPADPEAEFSGLDGTPDVTALRDPETDLYTLFLYHQDVGYENLYEGNVTGLKPEGSRWVLDPRYPSRTSYVKPNRDITYGERLFFDNGIYYLNYNTDSERIVGDWPDRLALAAGLHPYSQTLVNSADNENQDRPYFQRGGEFDHDNAAIWSGQMFKHRGRYYMYYENFHQIGDVDAPYQNYDALHAGSRLGYATGN